jgi:hypothetical protein
MRKFVGLTRYSVFVPALAAMLGAILLLAQGSIEVVVVVSVVVVVGVSVMCEFGLGSQSQGQKIIVGS